MDPYHDYVLDGIPVSRASRGPCIVCGHPTGDCTGNSPPPHHIIGFGDMQRRQSNATVVVPHDIFEEVQVTDRIRTQRLVARKGTYVTIEVARKHGFFE